MASPVLSEQEVDRAWEGFRTAVEGDEPGTFRRLARSQQELVGFALAASRSVHPAAPDLLSTLTILAIHALQSGPAHRIRKIKPHKIERMFGESIDLVRDALPEGVPPDDPKFLLELSSQPELFQSLGEVLLSTLAESEFDEIPPHDRGYLLAVLRCAVEALHDACRD